MTELLRNKIGHLIAASILSFGPACASYYGHADFTHSRVAQIEVGMTEAEVTGLFGLPDERELTTCGASTDNPWQCLIYRYRFRDSFEQNTFMFDTHFDPPRLNNYDIEKIYSDPVAPSASTRRSGKL